MGPHAHSQDGSTFIMLASKHNNEELVELALKHKADVNQKNEIQPVREVA